MKKLAIIGKPNVGKSSLFNRFIRERDAITSDIAGTTRDVKSRTAVVLNKYVEILDTGGLDQGCELFDRIKEKSREAALAADIILYMVDGKDLPQIDDKKFFYELETMGKDVALVVNKIDNDKMKEKLWEYYEFGTDTIFGVSVSHNRSVNALLEWIETKLPDEDIVPEPTKEEIEEETVYKEEKDASRGKDKFLIINEPREGEEATEFEDDGEYDVYDMEKDDDFEGEFDDEYYEEERDVDTAEYAEDDVIFDEAEEMKKYDVPNTIRIAIIGRVNVGKSSLLNALLDKNRAVVSSVAGTTIDPVDESLVYKGKDVTFVDTAGIRKRGKILGIEKYALMRTEKMLDNADIALVVLDASEPFLDLDEKIAGLIDENRLGCLIVLNKWDLVDRSQYDAIIEKVRMRFRFLHYAQIITVSAMTKERVNKIYDKLLEINENYSQHIPTSKLNRVIEMAMRSHHLPSMHGQIIRLYYATQYDIRPPCIALIMNKPQGLHFTYRRYLTNKMRQAFNFKGVPLLFKAKSRSSKK
ncbi:MAG: ribosome biogenesis GTPase Der [Helicobacteraceae bacterium]|nr:ribosome biogenesis GTPase Der [Helicobacteraceae bacterium]